MDFNTGSPGESGPPPPPRNEPSGASVGGASGEFNLSDPVQSFISTVRGVVLNPVGFFRGMRKSGDFINPLIFALICAVVSGVLTGILGFLVNLVIGFGFGSAVGSLFSYIIGVPIGTVIGLFITAGIFHLLVLLFVRPVNAGFEATFRVIAYAAPVYILLVYWLTPIQILGILVNLIVGIILLIVGIYWIFLYVIGIREAHSTTTGRAAPVVLIPVGVILVLTIILVIIAIIASAALLQQQQGF